MGATCSCNEDTINEEEEMILINEGAYESSKCILK